VVDLFEGVVWFFQEMLTVDVAAAAFLKFEEK
jgi:hypothetical protein